MRPRRSGHNFADDMFRCVFLIEKVWISIEISLEFDTKSPINNMPTMVQIMAWRLQATSHYLNQPWPNVLAHLCVTPPGWVLNEWLNQRNIISTKHSIGAKCVNKMLSINKVFVEGYPLNTYLKFNAVIMHIPVWAWERTNYHAVLSVDPICKVTALTKRWQDTRKERMLSIFFLLCCFPKDAWWTSPGNTTLSME